VHVSRQRTFEVRREEHVLCRATIVASLAAPTPVAAVAPAAARTVGKAVAASLGPAVVIRLPVLSSVAVQAGISRGAPDLGTDGGLGLDDGSAALSGCRRAHRVGRRRFAGRGRSAGSGLATPTRRRCLGAGDVAFGVAFTIDGQ
jgi:hypothetical protein